MAPNPLRLLSALLRALCALAVLLTALAGAPYALLRWGDLPRSVPSWTGVQEFLSGPVDDTLLVSVITVIGLGAWACFTVSCLVEAGAVLRHRATPKIRGLGVFQGAAGFLIGSIVLLAPAAASASAAPATPAVATATAHDARPTADVGDHRGPRAGVDHVTTADETPLWDLAQHHLGDGRRWREIADLNPHLADGPLPKGTVVRLPATQSAAFTDTVQQHRESAPASTYTVRKGDTLSAIAQEHLGTAGDWPKIYALNKGEVQPTGRTFTDPNLIFPGQHLDLPHHGTAAPDHTAPAQLPPHDRTTPTTPAPPAPQQAVPPSPSSADPTGVPSPTATDAPAQTGSVDEAAPSPARHASAAAPAAANDSRRADLFAGGGLLAASILTALAARRVLQQRRRRPGRRIAMPKQSAAAAETAMRTVQTPEGIAYIDAVLRTAAVHLTAAGRDLPDPAAAVYGHDGLTLHLHEPATPVPPFSAPGGDLARWHAPADSKEILSPPDIRDTDAPYPALVTLGIDPDGRTILVDLERYGLVQVTGPRRRQVLQALAVELATSTLADHVDVTVLGSACPGLAALLPERCSEHQDPAAAVRVLSGHHSGQQRALASARAASLRAARLGADTPASWTPRIILAADADSGPDVIGTLASITEDVPRTATAVVAAASTTATGRGWTLVADGTPIRLPGVDLVCILQELSAQDYADVLEIIATSAADTPDVPARPVPDPDPAAAPDREEPHTPPPAPAATGDDGLLMAAFAQLDDADEAPGPQAFDGPLTSGPHLDAVASASPAPADGPPVPETAGPVIRVLGPVDVIGAGTSVEQRYLRTVTEIAAWMTLHPGLDHRALDEALWPGREVSRTTRNPWVSRLRAWLGTTPEGAPHLPPIASTADARYRLADTVTSDWQQFQDLAGDGSTLGLHRALTLVRGRPFAAIPPRRYVWAEPLMQEMISAIVDAAAELAERYLSDGNPRPAIWAATIGLSAAPESEQLYRLLFRAYHAIGDATGLERAALRLDELNYALGCDMETETAEVLQRLLSPA